MSTTGSCLSLARRRIATGRRFALLAMLLGAPAAASAAACDGVPPATAQPMPALDVADDDVAPGELAIILGQSTTALRDVVVAMSTVWERTREAEDGADVLPFVHDWKLSGPFALAVGAAPGGCAAAPVGWRPPPPDSVFSYARASWQDEEVRGVRLEPLLSLEDETRLHPPAPSDDAP